MVFPTLKTSMVNLFNIIEHNINALYKDTKQRTERFDKLFMLEFKDCPISAAVREASDQRVRIVEPHKIKKPYICQTW